MKYYIEWSIVSNVCHKEDLVKTTDENATISRDKFNSCNFKDLNTYFTQKGFKRIKIKGFDIKEVMAKLAERQRLDIKDKSDKAIFKDFDFGSKNLLVLILILTNNYSRIKDLIGNEDISINHKFNLSNKLIQELIGYEIKKPFLINAAEAIALNKDSVELVTSGIIQDKEFKINSDIIKKSKAKKSILAQRKLETPESESKSSEETDKLKEYFTKYKFAKIDTKEFNIAGIIKYILSSIRNEKFLSYRGEDTLDFLADLFGVSEEYKQNLIFFAVLLTNRFSEFKQIIKTAKLSINLKINLIENQWLLNLIGFSAPPSMIKFMMNGRDAIKLNGIDFKKIEPYINSTEIDILRKDSQKKKKKKKKEKTCPETLLLGKFYGLDEVDFVNIKSVMPTLNTKSLDELNDLDVLELVKELRMTNNDRTISKINYKTPESLIKDELKKYFDSYFEEIGNDTIKAISPLSPIFSEKFTWPNDETLIYLATIMNYYEGDSETKPHDLDKSRYEKLNRLSKSQGISHQIKDQRSLLECISKILKEKKEIQSCYFQSYFGAPSLTPIEITICTFATNFICQKDNHIKKLIENTSHIEGYDRETKIKHMTDKIIILIIKFPHILENSKEKFSELLKIADFSEIYFSAFMISRLELFPNLPIGSESDYEANSKFYEYAKKKNITNFISRDNIIKAWSMSLFHTQYRELEDIFNYLYNKEPTPENIVFSLRLGYFFPIEIQKFQRNYVKIFQEENIEKIISMLKQSPKIFSNHPDKDFKDLDISFYKKYIKLHDEIFSNKHFEDDFYTHCLYKGITNLFNRSNLLYAWSAVNLKVCIFSDNLKFSEYLKIVLKSVPEDRKQELYLSLMFYFDTTSSMLVQDYQENPFIFLDDKDEVEVTKLDKNFRSITDEIALIDLSDKLEKKGHINIVKKIIHSRPCDIIRRLFKPSIDRYLNSEQKDILVPNPITDKDFTWTEEINKKICQLGKYFKIQKVEAGTLDYRTIEELEIKPELKTADDVYNYILNQLTEGKTVSKKLFSLYFSSDVITKTELTLYFFINHFLNIDITSPLEIFCSKLSRNLLNYTRDSIVGQLVILIIKFPEKFKYSKKSCELIIEDFSLVYLDLYIRICVEYFQADHNPNNISITAITAFYTYCHAKGISGFFNKLNLIKSWTNQYLNGADLKFKTFEEGYNIVASTIKADNDLTQSFNYYFPDSYHFTQKGSPQ